MSNLFYATVTLNFNYDNVTAAAKHYDNVTAAAKHCDSVELNNLAAAVKRKKYIYNRKNNFKKIYNLDPKI